MAFDATAALQAADELRRLHDDATAVADALMRLEHAPRVDRPRLALDFATRWPELGALGLVMSWTPEERDKALRTLLPDDARLFTLGLVESLEGRPTSYRALSAAMPRSFPLPDEAEWEGYRGHLRARVDAPLWGDVSGATLRALFVRPSATARVGKSARRGAAAPIAGDGPVADALACVVQQLTADVPAGPVFVLGGPGLGKSSLALVVAATLADDARVRPIFVRLRDVDPTRSLAAEVRRLLSREGFPTLAEHLATQERVVLVLDGFDELAQATRASMHGLFLAAHECATTLGAHAMLLTGRDALFTREDETFPDDAQLLTLRAFDDAQVAAWCARWFDATGFTFDGARYIAPEHPLRDVAAQPLMLYLLALMQSQGVALEDEATRSREHVYRRILDHVCRRHEALRPDDAWKAAQLRRFLRAAGFTAMVKGRESLHIDDLRTTLIALGLAVGGDAGRFLAEKTILSFTFRTPEQQHWEFTHRSFGEFLAAEQLATVCLRIAEVARGEFDELQPRVPIEQAVALWVEAFGQRVMPNAIDLSLGRLLDDAGPEVNAQLRARLGEIYRRLVDEVDGVAVATVAARWGRRFTEMTGATIAGAIQVAGRRELFEPEAHAPGRFGRAWEAMRAMPDAADGIAAIAGRYALRSATKGTFVPGMDVDGSCKGANFEAVEAERVAFYGSIHGANLSRVRLDYCQFSMTSLEDASFVRARLEGVGFHVFGDRVNFQRATLRDCRFHECRVRNSQLRAVYLTHVIFQECYLDDTTMDDAVLKLTDFYGHSAVDASFVNARLSHVGFTKMNLTRADFSGATFDNVHFVDCVLDDVKWPAGCVPAITRSAS